jgi:hypothetical protein
MSVLRAAGGREEEVGDVRVLQQFTQVGELDPASRSVKVMPAQPSHRTLSMGRRIAGIDVVSSRLLLNVDADGRVLFMELAWPDIDREVLERARAFGSRANDLPGQRLEGAEIESARPVVLHSPALGFYNDVTAAVQIVYRPNEQQLGKKPVRYLDAQGRDVNLPRDIDPIREAGVKRADIKR